MRDLQIADETSFDSSKIPFEKTLASVLDHFEKNSCEISVALIDDPHIHELNRKFLNHDFPTDVLTFPGETKKKNHLSGEIVISVDTARKNAEELKVPAEDEVLLYFIHGLLHLIGFDDHDESDEIEMRKMERHFMQLAGLKYSFNGRYSNET